MLVPAELNVSQCSGCFYMCTSLLLYIVESDSSWNCLSLKELHSAAGWPAWGGRCYLTVMTAYPSFSCHWLTPLCQEGVPEQSWPSWSACSVSSCPQCRYCFVLLVQSSLLIRWTPRYLNESSISMSIPLIFTGIGGGCFKVHHQLLGFPTVDLEVVLQAPPDEVLSQFSVLPGIPIGDEANNCWVFRELWKQLADL